MTNLVLPHALMEKFALVFRRMAKRRSMDVLQGESKILVYMSLSEKEGVKTLPTDISNVLCVSTARVACALNSLENKGYILRSIMPNDRRRIVVKLTAEGRKQAQTKLAVAMKELSALVDYLGEDDARELDRIMGRIIQYQTDAATVLNR